MREEYFGGIFYDKKELKAKPIMKKEWDLIISSQEEGKSKFLLELQRVENKELLDIVKHLLNKGAYDENYNLKAEIYRAPYPFINGALCAPIRTYLQLTDRCNLKCSHCMFARADFSKKEMSTEELYEVIKILKDARVPELRITGGEPTIRKDLFLIIKRAKNAGMYAMLNTNGVYGDAIRKKLADSGIDAIIFSLDGMKDLHEVRRGKGTFEKLLATFDFFSTLNKRRNDDEKIKLTANFTFGRSNICDFENVAKLCATYRINLNLMPLRPYGSAKVKLMDDMLSAREFMEFSEKVMNTRKLAEIVDSGIEIIHQNFDLFSKDPKESHLPAPFDRSSCGAAGFGLGINPDGKLNVCGFLSKIPEFQGPNILEVPFYDFWFSTAMHSFRTVVKRYCEGCKFYRKQCKGACKAMAYAKDKDLGGRDSYCFAHLI